VGWKVVIHSSQVNDTVERINDVSMNANARASIVRGTDQVRAKLAAK
jgi:hypothetical protein